MWMRWLPWRMFISISAKRNGFLDPIQLLSRLQRFSQPASVLAPTELLRSGAILHARGLVNSHAIQNNMDWVWPYWVARQFNPHDESFIPRAFALTHINMTHRNWTAVGLPDLDAFPIVDERGLLTPLLDGWSLDAWVICPGKQALIPARLAGARQSMHFNGGLAVITEAVGDWASLNLHAEVVKEGDRAVCRLRISAQADRRAWLALALRPYNPEGISFIHDIELLPGRTGWKVNGREEVHFDAVPDLHAFSHYRLGDVFHLLPLDDPAPKVRSHVGMATAAALFALEPDKRREISAGVPLAPAEQAGDWDRVTLEHGRVRLPDARAQYVWDTAVRALILHSPGPVYPGPYTYKRFWFRDAAFIVQALLCTGQAERAERALDLFPSKQTAFGYFLSQEGEWDSNGQALWAFQQFCQLTGRPVKPAWWPCILRGAQWIIRKRLPDGDLAHSGLLPAGFSAEHFGPNDYYYWDDFWAVAGLRAAAFLADSFGNQATARQFREEAADLLVCIERSLERCAQRLGQPAMPASPYRRLDAGAIGLLTSGYPLEIFDRQDLRLLKTAEYLYDHCLVNRAFFQEISHSGMNPYLTLHLAQVFLRAGDPRCFELIDGVLDLASSTGQWPEAVHPRTGGGCMGDGQHIWASAEWLMMIRNCFAREEGDRLVLGSGLLPRWLASGEPMSIQQAPTRFGTVSVTVKPGPRGAHVHWSGVWHGSQPAIELRLPGHSPLLADPDQNSAELP